MCLSFYRKKWHRIFGQRNVTLPLVERANCILIDYSGPTKKRQFCYFMLQGDQSLGISFLSLEAKELKEVIWELQGHFPDPGSWLSVPGNFPTQSLGPAQCWIAMGPSVWARILDLVRSLINYNVPGTVSSVAAQLDEWTSLGPCSVPHEERSTLISG